jgi:hypothetical protein
MERVKEKKQLNFQNTCWIKNYSCGYRNFNGKFEEAPLEFCSECFILEEFLWKIDELVSFKMKEGLGEWTKLEEKITEDLEKEFKEVLRYEIEGRKKTLSELLYFLAADKPIKISQLIRKIEKELNLGEIEVVELKELNSFLEAN